MKTYEEIFNRAYVVLLAEHHQMGVDVANLSVHQYKFLQHLADEITRGIVSLRLETVTHQKVIEEVHYMLERIGA